MDRIRLRFTGLTAYAATLITTFTGLVFTVVITRRLTAEELGTWRYIGTLVSYFTIPVGLFGFWATRLTAAGEKVLKTLTAMAITLSTFATAGFILLADIFSAPTGFTAAIFIAAALEIPSIYLYTSLESVAHAKKPHINYYAQLVQEFLKIPFAVVLVVVLRLGLLGAVAAAVAGFAARALTMTYLLREFDWGAVSRRIAVRMLSALWLPVYQAGAGALIALDTVIVVLLSGPEPAGYAAAVFLLGSLVSMSGTLAAGLYPKMLQESLGRDVENSISLVFLMAVPTAAGVVILGAPLLNVLRPEYSAAATVLPVVVVHAVLFMFASMMDSVIAGGERVDYSENVSFQELVKSRLFLLPTLSYLQAFLYLPMLFAAISIISPTDPTQVLAVWLTVNLATYIPFVIYKTKIARRSVPFKIPTAALATYTAAASVMTVATFLTKPEKLPVEVVPAITQLLPAIVVSMATYFSVLAAINREFRALVKAVVEFLF